MREVIRKIIRKELRSMLAEKLGVNEDAIAIVDVKKNNDVERIALSVNASDGTVATPCIYIEDQLAAIEAGLATLEDVAAMLEEQYRKLKETSSPFVLTKEVILENSFVQLVNAGKNAEMLKDAPHIDLLDMAGVIRVKVKACGKAGTVLMTSKLCESFGIDQEKLKETALENTRNSGFIVNTMGSMMAMLQGGALPEEADIPGLFVVTNDESQYGAAVMLFPDLFKDFMDKLGGNFFIIPSSVHEVLLFRDGLGPDAGIIKEWVREVNATQVAPEDVLSDNVYLYNAKENRIEAA